jgi:hypothetical protein
MEKKTISKQRRIYAIYKTIQKVWISSLNLILHNISYAIVAVIFSLIGGAVQLYGNYAGLPTQVSALKQEHIDIVNTIGIIKTELENNETAHSEISVKIDKLDARMTNTEQTLKSIDDKISALYLKLIK